MTTRGSLSVHYLSLLDIKDFNALVENKQFLDQPVKYKQQAYENLVGMSRN